MIQFDVLDGDDTDWLCDVPDFDDDDWGDDFAELESYWPDMRDVEEGADMFPHLPIAGGTL